MVTTHTTEVKQEHIAGEVMYRAECECEWSGQAWFTHGIAFVSAIRHMDIAGDQTVESCLMCRAQTTETVRGRDGDREGVMCADCQYWCDGNLVEVTA